ncbi:MAG: hypothetical protein CTY15_01955 [Methylocystis sp.]|nr:MAG: hypothetical protein CTY15_01955 [Methylocystis sp.]
MFEAAAAQKHEEALLVQRDWRADGGSRRVKLTKGGVHIARRYSGVDMMISVPVDAYRGVVLEVVEGREGAPAYRLSLAHRDRDLAVDLGENADIGAAAADWKAWAAFFGLPRLAVSDEGGFAPVDAAGSALLGARRRSNAAVRQRRPRFLTRRQAGALARMGEVFANEREIVCYE